MEDQIPTSHCSASFTIHNLCLIKTMTTAKKTEDRKTFWKSCSMKSKWSCVFIKVYTIKTVRVNISKSGECKGLRKTTKKMYIHNQIGGFSCVMQWPNPLIQGARLVMTIQKMLRQWNSHIAHIWLIYSLPTPWMRHENSTGLIIHSSR
jgi:hypothetical protein